MDLFQYDESDFSVECNTWASTTSQLSNFDTKIREGWDRALDNGHFRYKLDIETKIIGDKNYVAQLNVKRAQERRKPDAITTLNQPFNPASFNFTKIRPGEILFEMVKKTEAGNQLANGYSEGEASEGRTKHKRHLVIINVSPLEYGHVLLVPDVDACRPQVLTEEAIQMSIESTLLSKHRGFRIAFNSLCAYASVNHQHVHAYYLERELFVESAPVEHICDNLYELVCMPVKGFAFQLHGSDIQKLSRLICNITEYFQQNEVAHSLFMTRGCVFGQDKNSSNRTVRIYLWARKKFIGVKDEAAFNVAVAELAGHLPIKNVKDETALDLAGVQLAGHLVIKIKELYETLDEQKIEETLVEAILEAGEYDNVRQAVIKICEQSNKSI